MNDPSKLMNPPPPPQMIAQPPPPERINPVQPRIMNQTQGFLNHSIIMAMNQQPHVTMNNNNNNNNQPMMTNRRNFNPNHQKTNRNNNNWKIYSDRRPPMMDPIRRMYNPGGGAGGYKPPPLNELQSQNRLKTKKFYPKKKYGNSNRYVPYAPRNTTSFIIRAKKSGGIAELVSPCPVTPAVLPTPMFSPSREVLGDMAKEEWGVDGYGSMKGLIRLRPYGNDDDDEGGSSESDVEEHVEVERRLDHDLSRFEMIYPSCGGSEYNNVLENRVDDQDSHIAQLEEENLTLKERLFLMERELGDLRMRLQYLETRNMVGNEEVVENESESDGDDTGGSEARTSGDTKENYVAAEDVCMQDVAVNMDEAKEAQHTVGGGSSGENILKAEEQGEKEQCEEADRVVAGMDQSKENEMVIEKREDASENGFVGEQGTTI